MEPLVSIIIPCYNYGQWVKEAIISCLHQTYKKIEVIIVDDGSMDDSLEVITKIAGQHAELIKFVTQDNKGPSAARNCGVGLSKGEYLIFLDADDLLMEDAVDSFLKTINRQKVDAAVGDWIDFRNDSTEEELISYKFFFPDDPFASIVKQPIVISAVMFKRNNLKWNEDLVVNEGVEYYFDFLLNGNSIGHEGKVVTKIRQHLNPERLSIARDHFHPLKRLELFSKYKMKLKERGLLSANCEEAFDFQILSNIYMAKKMKLRDYDRYIRYLSIKNFVRYSWYKPFGLSGFVYRLGPKCGLESFYAISKLLRKI